MGIFHPQTTHAIGSAWDYLIQLAIVYIVISNYKIKSRDADVIRVQSDSLDDYKMIAQEHPIVFIRDTLFLGSGPFVSRVN